MDFFERVSESKKEEHIPSLEIFARKKGRALKRYGTKKPVEKVNKQELLTAWREDL